MPLVLSWVRAAYQSRMQIWACSPTRSRTCKKRKCSHHDRGYPPVRYVTMTLVTDCCENGAESEAAAKLRVDGGMENPKSGTHRLRINLVPPSRLISDSGGFFGGQWARTRYRVVSSR